MSQCGSGCRSGCRRGSGCGRGSAMLDLHTAVLPRKALITPHRLQHPPCIHPSIHPCTLLLTRSLIHPSIMRGWVRFAGHAAAHQPPCSGAPPEQAQPRPGTVRR